MYDLVVYGATGFTGGLVAEYLAQSAPRGLRWAIAGRSVEKLTAVRARLGASAAAVPIVHVEGDAGMTTMTRNARVVLSTVGPFVLHGESLVASCIENGCDYVDSTGESGWVSYMISKYGERATARGVLLVSMCGYDSIPADMGTYMLARHVHTVSPGTGLASVRSYVKMSGSASGGTAASFFSSFEVKLPGGRNPMNPTLLVPKGPGLPPPETLVVPSLPPLTLGRTPAAAGPPGWSYFFFMSPINTAVVRRSAALYAIPHAGRGGASPYSRAPFAYSEALATRSMITALLSTIGFMLFFMASQVSFLRTIMRRYAPVTGTGPSAEKRARSHFQYTLVGETDEARPRTVVGVVSGGDPGYGETAKMLAECAILAATSKDQLPAAGFGYGFLTPATAFGYPLLQRLRAAGLRMEVTQALGEEPAVAAHDAAAPVRPRL